MEKNNIFNFATSELSQDAFICWLCNWVNFDDNSLSEDEKKLKLLATEFIEKMLGEKLEDRKVNIKRQYQKIDVLLEIQNKTEFITNENEKNPVVDIYVIIEDKVETESHSDQINRYKKLISKKNKSKAQIKTVYYKTYDEDNMENLKENGVNVIFGREKILELFGKYKDNIKDSIFRNYYDYLSNIETDVDSYEEKNLEDWNSNCYIGFFKELKKEESCLEHADGRKKDCSWKYVSNKSGGFMGIWWFPLKMEEVFRVTKKFQLWQNQLELNNDLYLQIEQFDKKEKETYNKKNIIAVKYSLTDKEDDKYDEKVKISSEIRNKIYEELKDKLGKKELSFKKKKFTAGQYMTVGYLEFENIDDCKKKIEVLQATLKKL